MDLLLNMSLGHWCTGVLWRHLFSQWHRGRVGRLGLILGRLTVHVRLAVFFFFCFLSRKINSTSFYTPRCWYLRTLKRFCATYDPTTFPPTAEKKLSKHEAILTSMKTKVKIFSLCTLATFFRHFKLLGSYDI